MFGLLAEKASEIAPQIHLINSIITWLSLFFTVAIVGAMIYFAVKYRKKNGVDHETPAIEGSHILELIWTVVPTIICIIVAAYGVMAYYDMRLVANGALEINVTGRQWAWDFEYKNGKKTTDMAVVPVNEPVKFLMTSKDVLHSFFSRDMAVKNDVVPGRYTYVTFTPVKTGDYPIFCTEYCGLEHSGMLATLKVVPKAEYDRWINDRSAEVAASRMSPADRGAKLYAEKGCNACHSLDGTPRVGPSYQGLFGKSNEMSDGTKLTVDENYLKESILMPAKQLVKGYANLMPAFEGTLSNDEVGALIAFIKDLDNMKSKVVDTAEVAADNSQLTPIELGKKLYTEKTCVACHSLDGSKLVGPSFKGIYGRKGKLADGTAITADDAYITKSIKEPTAQVVEGYQPVMPPMPLKDEEVGALVEYLKTIK